MFESQIVREILERQDPDVRACQAVALFLPDVREPEREEHVAAQRLLLKEVVVLGEEFVDDRLVDVLAFPVPHVLLAFEIPKRRDTLLHFLLGRNERIVVRFPRGNPGVIGVLSGHRRRNFAGWRTAWNGRSPDSRADGPISRSRASLPESVTNLKHTRPRGLLGAECDWGERKLEGNIATRSAMHGCSPWSAVGVRGRRWTLGLVGANVAAPNARDAHTH